MPSERGQRGCQNHVSSALRDQLACLLHEGVHAVLVHVVKLLHSIHSRCLNNVLRLRRPDALHLDALLVLQQADDVLLPQGVKSHACPLVTTSCSAASSMHIHVQVLRRVRLHDQIHGGHVQSSSCNVRGHKAFDAPRPEAVHDSLTLVLADISMQHPRPNRRKLLIGRQLITLLFGVCEDQGLAKVACMHLAQVSDAVATHVGRTADALVRNLGIRGIGIIRASNVDPGGLLKVLLNEIVHPFGQSCREQHLLQVLLWQCLENALDILLEAHGKHLVCLVQHHHAAAGEVYCLSPDVVKQSPWRCH
mmetsp:Transcript_88963/g.147192  ORF Transcript_88963/g.147192 Transcript_88963/m.147192 type:complete len:307 (-) Transcript_88963:15-935(-)